MRYDLAVVGSPFLDLTFAGLPHLPRLGEEVMAGSLQVAPGGTGMQAIGAARLGLTTALVAPIGRAGGAGLVRTLLEADGVAVVRSGDPPDGWDPNGFDIPTTALLGTAEGVAMATSVQGREPTAEEVAAVSARAMVASIGRLELVPTGPALYAVTGGLELASVDEAALDRLGRARTLILNAGEAAALTGRRSVEEAGVELARRGPTVAVTLGGRGALAIRKGKVAFTPAPAFDVVDATGAGDLFTAAYVWADLRGASTEGCLAWASLYAGLSVRAPTAYAGAVTLEELLAEGNATGLDRRLGDGQPASQHPRD